MKERATAGGRDPMAAIMAAVAELKEKHTRIIGECLKSGRPLPENAMLVGCREQQRLPVRFQLPRVDVRSGVWYMLNHGAGSNANVPVSLAADRPPMPVHCGVQLWFDCAGPRTCPG